MGDTEFNSNYRYWHIWHILDVINNNISFDYYNFWLKVSSKVYFSVIIAL